MEVITKKLRNSLGAVLMYVVMAITVVAAIAISITLVATNLYSRTASRSSDQQAYLLAKSIGQTFAAENQYVRNIVSYLSEHPSEKVTAKASVYFDPSTMTTYSNVNRSYLSGLSLTDAYMSFYLSDKQDYLYGDVTVNYNGASATATLVMTCDAPASFERNMKSLFDNYDIYATQPNGMSFAMAGQSGDSVYPSVALYNDSSTPANYKLSTDINADLTMTGPFQLQSSTSDTRKIKGNVSSYGDLQLYTKIELPATSGKYLTVNGKLTIGKNTTEVTSVAVKRSVYCLNDVTVQTKAGDGNQIVTGTIYSEGNVTITNAKVSNIYAVSGNIKVVGGTVGSISTKGTVELQNCTVTGTVYAGALKVTNSTITGNVTVQGANIAGSSILPQGDMEVNLTSVATANQSIGSSSGSKIYVGGNLRVANYSSTKSLTLNGTVEVGGGLQNPLNSSGYPYLTTINGNLIVRKGVKTEVTSKGASDYYNLSYLIGLNVQGDVALDWSVPVFTASGRDTLGNVASHYFTGDGLPAAKATSITGTLFICTNGKGTDGLAGSFCLFKHPLLSTAAAFTLAIESNQLLGNYLSYCDIYLNNATLNNIAVGSSSAYMGVATFGDILVCGGTINGSVYAHNICFNDIKLSTSIAQRVLARTSSGNPGNIYLGTRSISGSNVNYMLDMPAVRSGETYTDVYGVVDATGNIAVSTGVHFISTAQLNCRQSLLLAGCDVDGLVVVGNSVSNNSLARVYRNVKMGASDAEHGFYVNGTLEVPQSGSYPEYSKAASAYVTALNVPTTSIVPFLNIYVYSSESGVVSGNGFTITYMGADGTDTAVTNLTQPYTVFYESASAKSDTADTHYVRANAENNSNILNTSFLGTGANQVLYFDCSATISGDLIFAGYVVVKAGANLTVTGNLRCRSVQSIAAANIDNMSVLAYLSDNAGSAHAISYLTVGGTFQATAERADITFSTNCSLQNVLLATTGIATFEDCEINGNIAAANAEVRMQNYAYLAGSVSCRRFSAVDSSFLLSNANAIYASGDAVTVNDCIVSNIYAKNARVELRTASISNGGNIVCKQLVTDDVAINAKGLYILGEEDSTCKNICATAYTIYVNYCDLTLKDGSRFGGDVTVYYTGAGRVIINGAIASAVELIEDSDDYNALMEQIDVWCTAPVMEGLDSTIQLVEYDDLLSYDKQLVNYVAFTCPNYITNSQKVTYQEIASMGQMTITESTYWSEQALPLEWVFPSDTANVAKTVDGEIVDLRNNGTTGDKMSIAYKSLDLWSTASAFGQTLLNGLLDSFDAARESLSWRDLIPPYGDTIIRLARIVINHIANVVIPNMLSVSSVNSFAGISNTPDAYLRYYCNNYNSKVKDARGSADILVTSVSYLHTNSTAYAALSSNSLVKWFLDRLDSNSDLVKLLKSLGWGGWEYIYRPCGVFFFNSGYVPEEVFTAYKTKDHNTYYSPSASNYRTYYTSSEKDSEGRWYWGGSGSVSGSAADCTWTFFTCTDPANPYTSSAKDLHIVLPKHTYFTWLADKENCVRIIGNGRVFLYLQEDTNIKIVGNYWDNAMATKDAEVFGGLRYVGVLGGETYYNYTSGRPTSVAYMDQKTNRTITVGGKSVTITPQLQPRMFVIGTGPHISFTVEDFQLAAYVYMPNGALYTSSDWSGAAKYNSLIISNTSKSSAVQSDVYGMYVVDKIITQGQADYSVKYYSTSVDLSDTTIYYNATRVTTAREKNSSIAYYRLAEFWSYPDGMPTADLPWYYKGIAIN